MVQKKEFSYAGAMHGGEVSDPLHGPDHIFKHSQIPPHMPFSFS